MNVTRIGQSTTTSVEAIRDALTAREKAHAISGLTHLQIIDALVPISKGSSGKSLPAHIGNISSASTDTWLKDKLTRVAVEAGKLKEKSVPPQKEDLQSASQIRDQVQKFELVLAGNLDGITVIPASTGMFEGVTLKEFLGFPSFGSHTLDDPRKLPLFYTPEKEINFDDLGLTPAEREKLEFYLQRRDEMLSDHTIRVSDDSRPFLLDDLKYLQEKESNSVFRINRGVASPIVDISKAEAAININGSRARFDTYPATRVTDISTYMTFRELQANFSNAT